MAELVTQQAVCAKMDSWESIAVLLPALVDARIVGCVSIVNAVVFLDFLEQTARRQFQVAPKIAQSLRAKVNASMESVFATPVGQAKIAALTYVFSPALDMECVSLNLIVRNACAILDTKVKIALSGNAMMHASSMERATIPDAVFAT